MLDTRNLEVTYSNICVVVRGVSFQVGDGQIVALLGNSGAGKVGPLIVEELSHILKPLNIEQEIAMLAAEQNARAALSLANYGYVMQKERIVADGHLDDFMRNEDIEEFYAGFSKVERRSYRDVKHYERRKRWLR